MRTEDEEARHEEVPRPAVATGCVPCQDVGKSTEQGEAPPTIAVRRVAFEEVARTHHHIDPTKTVTIGRVTREAVRRSSDVEADRHVAAI